MNHPSRIILGLLAQTKDYCLTSMQSMVRSAVLYNPSLLLRAWIAKPHLILFNSSKPRDNVHLKTELDVINKYGWE
jgi:hypothetical protein